MESIIDKIKSGRDALIVGGSNGVGLIVANTLAQYCHVVIVDKVAPTIKLHENIEYIKFDLLSNNFDLFNKFKEVDKLIITAGFGKLALFKDYTEEMLINMMSVNAIAVMRIIQHFYPKILAKDNFYCAIMVSIAGFMSSPFFAVYGASKAALKIFIESLNVELLKSGTSNQILNISPGLLKGTSFYGGSTDTAQLQPFANELIKRMMNKEDLWIPQYNEIYKKVLKRYTENFRAEGAHSYDYKLNSGRL